MTIHGGWLATPSTPPGSVPGPHTDMQTKAIQKIGLCMPGLTALLII